MTNRITPSSRYPADYQAAWEMAQTDLAFCDVIKREIYDGQGTPWVLITRRTRAQEMLRWLANEHGYNYHEEGTP